MKQEINFAENDKRLRDEPTLDDCRAQGATAYAYGWSPVPWGHWSEERKAAYHEGYQAAKQKAKI